MPPKKAISKSESTTEVLQTETVNKTKSKKATEAEKEEKIEEPKKNCS